MTRASIEQVRAERRRRWTRSEKKRLVVASFEPGVSASEVARETDLHVSLLFRWHKLLCEHVVPSLVPVAIVPTRPSLPAEPKPKPPRTLRPTGVMKIELGDGRRLTVDHDVDVVALRRVLNAL